MHPWLQLSRFYARLKIFDMPPSYGDSSSSPGWRPWCTAGIDSSSCGGLWCADERANSSWKNTSHSGNLNEYTKAHMYACVYIFFKYSPIGETLLAGLHRAHERLLAGMQTHVTMQHPRAIELLVALLTFVALLEMLIAATLTQLRHRKFEIVRFSGGRQTFGCIRQF